MVDRGAVYLWFDAEFNSLDLDQAVFLQVACMATDVQLNRLLPADDDINLYLRIDPGVEVSEWVEENLQPVLCRCRGAEAVDASELEPRLLAYLDQALGPREVPIFHRPVLAGNSVHNDWMIARRLVPEFVRRCHYRLLDASMLKQQWTGFWGGEAFDKEDAAEVLKYFPGLVHEEGAMQQHDAYYDIQASAAELGFYRAHLNARLD